MEESVKFPLFRLGRCCVNISLLTQEQNLQSQVEQLLEELEETKSAQATIEAMEKVLPTRLRLRQHSTHYYTGD